MSLLIYGNKAVVRKKIKKGYANESIHNMILGGTKISVYQFKFDGNGNDNTHIIQYFDINRL